jgi:hypothetical protein
LADFDFRLTECLQNAPICIRYVGKVVRGAYPAALKWLLMGKLSPR